MQFPGFSIELAEPKDVPAIEAIGKAAMSNDKQTVFKKLAKAGTGAENGTAAPIADWMEHPRIRVLKAVDDETKEILGCVCWAYSRGYEVHTQDQAAPPAKPKDEDDAQVQEIPPDPIDRLNKYTSDDFEEWMDKTMPPGVKCLYICSISVHPRHQGRGVGKALIRWGTARADEDGVFCWVHSSEAGYPVMLKEGFEVDRTLEFSLDEYAKDVDKEEVRNQRWGTYTLRYMIRQPNAHLVP